MAGHPGGVAQVLDQFQAEPEGKYLGTVDILDVVGELAPVAAEFDAIAQRILGRRVLFDDLGTEFDQATVDLGATLLHLLVDVESLGHLVLLGKLEAQHELLAIGPGIEGVTRGIGSAML